MFGDPAAVVILCVVEGDMKLLYCESCGDIIAPYREANKPRYCVCERHAVWWTDPTKGVLSVFDTWKPTLPPACYIIGIHNGFLNNEQEFMREEDYRQVIRDTPESYYFKQFNTVAIRIRPGTSNDTSYAECKPVNY
jgi:hypothetical protein